ncbi:MAG: hypothetical protein JO189_12250 [Deltaproteobacteria bacterium]|nr:hypothetical protein [Deltaproteobacteria bacterium]
MTKDAAWVKRSMAITLMACLVSMRVKAKDIHPGPPWSAFTEALFRLGGEHPALQTLRPATSSPGGQIAAGA